MWRGRRQDTTYLGRWFWVMVVVVVVVGGRGRRDVGRESMCTGPHRSVDLDAVVAKSLVPRATERAVALASSDGVNRSEDGPRQAIQCSSVGGG